MQFEFPLLFGIVMAYLIGSIPTSVWFGQYFYGTDVREHGSGNAGATNTMRVLGVKAGVIVLAIDILKGVGVIALSVVFKSYFSVNEYFVIYQLIIGLIALVGHLFPVFAGFNGGKGVATLAGIVLALFPEVFLICLGIFVSVFLPTRYVSLGSILSAIAFPVFVIFVFKVELVSKIVFSVLTAAILLLAHRKNIQRLLKGKERKVLF